MGGGLGGGRRRAAGARTRLEPRARTPAPGAAQPPPPRPALLGNRSPWRRETPPSPGLVRAGSPETKSPHDAETSQHRCGRAHEPRGPRRDLVTPGIPYPVGGAVPTSSVHTWRPQFPLQLLEAVDLRAPGPCAGGGLGDVRNMRATRKPFSS